MLPNVSIVVLNWNGWKDTIECLESLYQINYNNFDVIVVDNASEDNSIEMLNNYAKGKIKVKSKFFDYNSDNKPIKVIEFTKSESEYVKKVEFNKKSEERLLIIKNDENSGFAEGNNIGIRFSRKLLNPDYFLILNNDTVVEQNFLKELIKVSEKDKKIGIVGPKICYYDNPFKLHLKKRYDDLESPIETYISGCCFLVKREVIDTIGNLDNTFFLFFEETDFFLRTLTKYKVMYVPTKNIVFHKFSPSVAKLKNTSIYYVGKSGVIFFRKHKKLIFIDYWASIFINSIILKKNIAGFKCFIKGIINGLKMELNYDS